MKGTGRNSYKRQRSDEKFRAGSRRWAWPTLSTESSVCQAPRYPAGVAISEFPLGRTNHCLFHRGGKLLGAGYPGAVSVQLAAFHVTEVLRYTLYSDAQNFKS